MKILNRCDDFFRLCAAKVFTAPLKLLFWTTDGLSAWLLGKEKKKMKKEIQAQYAVSSSYAISGSWSTYPSGVFMGAVGSVMSSPQTSNFADEKAARITVHILKD